MQSTGCFKSCFSRFCTVTDNFVVRKRPIKITEKHWIIPMLATLAYSMGTEIQELEPFLNKEFYSVSMVLW